MDITLDPLIIMSLLNMRRKLEMRMAVFDGFFGGKDSILKGRG